MNTTLTNKTFNGDVKELLKGRTLACVEYFKSSRKNASSRVGSITADIASEFASSSETVVELTTFRRGKKHIIRLEKDA